MKRLTFLLVTVLSGATVVSQAQETGRKTTSAQPSWKRYTVEGEEFSVLLPALPAMTTTRAMRKSDHESQIQRQLEISEDGLLYTVEVYQNPKPTQSLDEFISERTDIKCKPASERTVIVDGYSGKECSSAEKNYPAILQFFATETRLYRFLVRGRREAEGSPREFFSSIRLGKNTEGIKVSDGFVESNALASEPDERVRLLEKPEPSYTEEARANKTTGTVILKVVFTSRGTVENIRVVRELPNGLTERAIEAAKKIKFKPAVKDGHPVSMWMQLEYVFWP
jgi:TonB family protein